MIDQQMSYRTPARTGAFTPNNNQTPRAGPPNSSFRLPNTNTTAAPHRPFVTCAYCGKNGYTVNRCYSKQRKEAPVPNLLKLDAKPTVARRLVSKTLMPSIPPSNAENRNSDLKLLCITGPREPASGRILSAN